MYVVPLSENELETSSRPVLTSLPFWVLGCPYGVAVMGSPNARAVKAKPSKETECDERKSRVRNRSRPLICGEWKQRTPFAVWSGCGFNVGVGGPKREIL
jgi:hypothetical protein